MVSSFFFFCPPRLPRSVAVFCYRSLFIYFVVRALTLDTFPCLAFPLQDEGSFFLFSLKLGLPFFKYVLLPRSILDGSVSLQVFLVISAGGEPASFHLSLTKKNNNNNGRREKKTCKVARQLRCLAGVLLEVSRFLPLRFRVQQYTFVHTHTHTQTYVLRRKLTWDTVQRRLTPLPCHCKHMHTHVCFLNSSQSCLFFLLRTVPFLHGSELLQIHT
jgi:hypothetical protein